MRRSLRMGLMICALISLSAWTAAAQQIASLAELKDQIHQLQKIVGSAGTPANVKASDLKLLAEKRAQLQASLQNQIGALRKYQTAYQSRFSPSEMKSVNESIQSLEKRTAGIGGESSFLGGCQPAA